MPKSCPSKKRHPDIYSFHVTSQDFEALEASSDRKPIRFDMGGLNLAGACLWAKAGAENTVIVAVDPGPPPAMTRAFWTSLMPLLRRTCHQTPCCPNISSWMEVPVPPAATRQHSSSAKVRSYLHFLKRKIKMPPTPPYSHVCQVGDPVLRGKAEEVDPGAVRGAEVQKVIGTLVRVMRRLESVGLSAPQIGVPLRILALEFPESMLQDASPAGRNARGLVPVPLRVFINPHLRILDAKTASFMEACESITGFSACVPRYLSVEVSGLNEMAEPVTWQVSGWPARILQHEMDHLDGILYVDRMDSRTFTNIHWAEYND